VNRIESPEINSHIYSQVIFEYQGTKIIQWGKTAFSKTGAGKTGYATWKKKKIEEEEEEEEEEKFSPYLILYTKIN